VGGVNPGQGRVRLALVAAEDECLEAARRIAQFTVAYRGIHPDTRP
jgi:N-succinyldiaminopimelate aminotransferase